MMSGDGYKPKNYNSWRYVSASSNLIKDFSTLCSSLGIITSKHSTSYFDKRTNKVYKSYTAVLTKVNQRTYKTGTTYYQLPIKNKTKCGKITMIDIEVDGGLFIINDGVISHNSIWDKPSELDEWFDRVFSDGKKQIEFSLPENEDEIER